MLWVLQDTEFCPKRRWARSLRWWRRRRGLRDCVFGDPGSLGVELDMDDEANWVVKATHPPASVLNLKNGSRLESVNLVRVTPRTLRVDIWKWIAMRPVCLTFRTPKSDNDTVKVEDVFAEVIVAEVRERYPSLKATEPPLSLASEVKVR